MVIVPSRSDTLPLVSLDALSSGVPLVCTLQTGTSAYIEDGISGYVIPTASVKDMVQTLRKVLARRAEWERVGAAGAAVFDKHFAQEAFRSRLNAKVHSLLSATES
jgi:glycosyltransferase involved in cell wall biosynthesis